MKKHVVIIDMTNNFLNFWPGHCIYVETFSLTLLSQSILLMKTAVVRIEKDITPQKIIKRGLTENMTDFLLVLNKLSSKKRRQINKNK